MDRQTARRTDIIIAYAALLYVGRQKLSGVTTDLSQLIFSALHCMQRGLSYEHLSVCPSVCPSVKRVNCDKTKAPSEKSSITRKRAIAKALQPEGHFDFAPVDLAYYQHFLFFFVRKYCVLGSSAWQPQMQVT